MTCASCTSLLQLGLSLSVQAQRLDRESRAIAAGTGPAPQLLPRAERLAAYDRRLAAWQASVREHLEQHQGEGQP